MSSRSIILAVGAATVAAVLGAAVAAAAVVQPPRIIQTTAARFPDNLATLNLASGEAQVVVNVDNSGRLADWLVSSYTDRAFADAAVHALQQWRYEPARVDGRPVGACLRVNFTFKADKKVLELNATTGANQFVDSIFGAPVTRLIWRPRDLDRPVRVLRVVSPVNPTGLLAPAAPAGRVVLDFFIDAAGHPRMPVVVSSTATLYALAAVQALAQWRFTPPTRGGLPVAVEVEQEFIFNHQT